MDEDSLNQFLSINQILRKKVYSIQMPEAIILDLDFLQPILDEYLEDFPEIKLLLRGDSGFATLGLYKQCEENGIGYVIRLKENAILRDKASSLVDEIDEITKNNKVDYAVVYGEFMYQAGPWPYERRVVCKVEKPENQMTYMYTFIVTNMESSPEYLIKFYCKRGLMENFIKESKTGFALSLYKILSLITKLLLLNFIYQILNQFSIFNFCYCKTLLAGVFYRCTDKVSFFVINNQKTSFLFLMLQSIRQLLNSSYKVY